MEDSLKDVVEAPSTSGVNTESPTVDSANAEVPVETPTKKVEQKEVPFNEHPRWREVQEEKKLARQEAEYWRQQAQQALEVAKGSQPKVDNDPYVNMTPEEKAFWEKARDLARQEAKKEVEEIKKQYDPYIEKYERETVQTVYESFKEKHPDITQEDEIAMARLVKPLRQSGMSAKEALDYAYRATFFDKNAQKTVQQIKQKEETKTQQKASANLETVTTYKGAIPTKEKMSLRDFARAEAKKLGI